MTSDRVVLVTGVAGYWGSRVAARLLAGGGYRVLGLDTARPAVDLVGLDFVQVDVRNPLLAELLRAECVDTLCHLATAEEQWSGDDLIVAGTANLMEACAAAGVQTVVVMSRTTVYGARPGNSAFLSEDSALRPVRRDAYATDLADMEAYLRTWRHQAAGISLAILRFPGIVGPAADTPLTRFLSDRRAPMVMGFDPRMQLIHEDDVVGALVHAAMARVDGEFNVAAEGILPLSKMRGLVHKPPFSVAKPFAERARRSGRLRRHFPLEPDYLCYPCVADLHKLRTQLEFAPQYTADQALRQFAQVRLGRESGTQSAARFQNATWLEDLLEQRRLAAAGQPDAAADEEGR